MATTHIYLAVEDIALTEEQRDAVIAAFRELGPGSSTRNEHLNQKRVSTDGSKAIFEALFQESNLTVANVKQFVADAVGVDPGIIDDATTQTQYGPLVTYSVNAVDRIRFLVFDSVGSTWEESRVKAILYLKNNAAEWGETVA